MTEVIVFLLTFVVVFLIYELILVRKYKKGKSDKRPVEVTYLLNRYNLNLKKVNYKKLLNIVSLVSSFDIAVVVTVMGLTDNFLFLTLLTGIFFLIGIFINIILTIILILSSYSIVGKIYKKKGYTK